MIKNLYIEIKGEYLGLKFKKHEIVMESIACYLNIEADPEYEVEMKKFLVHIIPLFVEAKGNFGRLAELIPEEVGCIYPNIILRLFAYTVNKLSPECIDFKKIGSRKWSKLKLLDNNREIRLKRRRRKAEGVTERAEKLAKNSRRMLKQLKERYNVSSSSSSSSSV